MWYSESVWREIEKGRGGGVREGEGKPEVLSLRDREQKREIEIKRERGRVGRRGGGQGNCVQICSVWCRWQKVVLFVFPSVYTIG